VPNQGIAIGALAWQAARRELERRATPWWGTPFRFIGFSQRGSARWASDTQGAARSDRLAAYEIAADRVAARLNQVEEAELRQTGALPDWFFDAVEEERKAYRSRRRR
jgi:hypothetical protein